MILVFILLVVIMVSSMFLSMIICYLFCFYNRHHYDYEMIIFIIARSCGKHQKLRPLSYLFLSGTGGELREPPAEASWPRHFRPLTSSQQTADPRGRCAGWAEAETTRWARKQNTKKGLRGVTEMLRRTMCYLFLFWVGVFFRRFLFLINILMCLKLGRWV